MRFMVLWLGIPSLVGLAFGMADRADRQPRPLRASKTIGAPSIESTSPISLADPATGPTNSPL
jgi:hypothetical protein